MSQYYTVQYNNIIMHAICTYKKRFIKNRVFAFAWVGKLNGFKILKTLENFK